MTTSRASGMSLHSPFRVFEDFKGRKPAGRAHHASAGVGRRSAHIEIPDGSAKLRISRRRTQKEKLLQRKLALKDIAFSQSKFALQIERRQHLPVQNDVFDVGSILAQCVDYVIAEGLALLIPIQT